MDSLCTVRLVTPVVPSLALVSLPSSSSSSSFCSNLVWILLSDRRLQYSKAIPTGRHSVDYTDIGARTNQESSLSTHSVEEPFGPFVLFICLFPPPPSLSPPPPTYSSREEEKLYQYLYCTKEVSAAIFSKTKSNTLSIE